jgi:hypothetical protein
MKKLSILFVAVALLGFAGASMAQGHSSTTDHTVTVNVPPFTRIALGGNVSIDLVDDNTDAVYDSEEGSTTITYSHNGNSQKGISVEVTSVPADPNDIDLDVRVGSGTNYAIAVGGAAEPAVALISNIDKGAAVNANITYTAKNATFDVTSAGDTDTPVSYVFEVTYTLTN